MIRVAIVDDHSVVRMGFKYMLAFAKIIVKCRVPAE